MHPNGVSTVQAYRQVTCWDPESEYQHLLTIGVLASLVPLAFLSLCAWVTYSLPRRLRQGDTVFLRTFAFLLFRFRPGAFSVFACGATAELHLGSCANDFRPRLRNFRFCHCGRGLHSPKCTDVAMGRTPGEPSGRRHAHRIVAYFTPRGAADRQCGRSYSWKLACGSLLGGDVCVPGCVGVESPSLRPPTSEAFSVLLNATTKLEEVPSVDC